MKSFILFLIVICCFFIGRRLVKRWRARRRIEQIGKQGEANIAHSLRHLPGTYTVFNDLMLKKGDGRLAQIDHVVVSPYGIFVIETKFRHGRISGQADADMWRQTIGSKRHTFENPLRQNAVHVRTIQEYLPSIQASLIHSVIVMPHDTEISVSHSSNVIHEGQLLMYIRKFQTECIYGKQLKMAIKVLQEKRMAGSRLKRAHVRDTKRHHGG